MAVKPSDVASKMQAELKEIAPKIESAIDAYCEKNLASRYDFNIKVEALEDGDMVYLSIDEGSEFFEDQREVYWEPSFMQQVMSALKDKYLSTGWDVAVTQSGLECSLHLNMSK